MEYGKLAISSATTELGVALIEQRLRSDEKLPAAKVVILLLVLNTLNLYAKLLEMSPPARFRPILMRTTHY